MMDPTTIEPSKSVVAALMDALLAVSHFSWGQLFAAGSDPPRTLVLLKTVERPEGGPLAAQRQRDPELSSIAPDSAYLQSLWLALVEHGERVDEVNSLRAGLPEVHAYHAQRQHLRVWRIPLRCDVGLIGYITLAGDGDAVRSDATRATVQALCGQLGTTLASALALSPPQPAPTTRGPHLQGLDEWAKASEALHDAIAGLAGVEEAQTLLAAVLADALRVAGTGNGALVLLEGEPGRQVANHIVVLENGAEVSAEAKREHQFDRVPLEGGVRVHADMVSATPRGVTSAPSPNSLIYADGPRKYLTSLGVQSVHAVGLRSGGRMLGWLGAGYSEPPPVSADRIDLLCLLASQMAIAVDLARLAAQARSTAQARKRDEMALAKLQDLSTANRVLRGAIDAMAKEASLDAVLAYALQSICENLSDTCCSGMLWLMDAVKEVQHLHMVFEGGRIMFAASSSHLAAVQDQSLDPSWISLQGDPDRPLAVAPSQLPLPVSRLLVAEGVDRLISFPMLIASKPVGVLLISLTAHSPVPAADNVLMAQALTQQCTLALQMTRWAEADRRIAVVKERELAALRQVAEQAKANRSLRRSLELPTDEFDIDVTLGHVLQVISEHIDCPSSTLCMRNAVNGEFLPRLVLANGVVKILEWHDASMLPAPEPLSEFWKIVVEEGRACMFDPRRPTSNNSGLQSWCEHHGVMSLLALPLVERGRATGCFLFKFADARDCSDEQMELLQTLAHHATVVVQMGRLHAQAESRLEHEATLAERLRIAREFHDTLAQGLTGILMHLQAAQTTTDPAQARTYLASALAAARHTFTDVRRSLQALRAVVLEHAAFTSALGAVLESTFAGSGVNLLIAVQDAAEPVDETTESELLRIAQEAAANTLKHASATQFMASVGFDGGLVMLLEDDGVGFDLRLERDGYGLIGIKERAERIGASCTIESRVGVGTRITVASKRRHETR